MAETREYKGIALIRAEPPCGMITLRGGPDAAKGLATAGKRLGVKMPGPLGAELKDDRGLLWMSPDEVLMLCPAEDVPDHLDALRGALKGHHAMAVDTSDMRVRFSVSGAHAREVLAKLCPLDLAPDRFGPGHVRRTRLGQVAAAIWMRGDGAFEVICFRSVGQYVLDLLQVAAAPGSEVHLFSQPVG
ncbi:sarcosine oxidase subunit gamma [Marinibacterium profundimaris]|uniref:Sarcosine oxidase subunit gamma n=1 Tax=Marinibacterium profundimaris TaxID=1679460 RepID=A0A225NYI5_9RHOB|nr:sarcosine oxidase subunit gamma family protein [Marinibacterium profundimaris]OWU77226.1 hypothetical protein ATO3_00290 [Marinibacterium profundimaris]